MAPKAETNYHSQFICTSVKMICFSHGVNFPRRFLATLEALYLPFSLTYLITDLLTVLDIEPSRPNQTKSSWSTSQLAVWRIVDWIVWVVLSSAVKTVAALPRGKLSESTPSFLISTHKKCFCRLFLLLSSLLQISFLTFPSSFPHFYRTQVSLVRSMGFSLFY